MNKEDLTHKAFLNMTLNLSSKARGQRSQSRRLRCLPFFYLAGFSKCGTTDLYEQIMFHPEVFRPFVKEPQYWNWNRWKVIVEGHTQSGFTHEQVIPLGVKVKFSQYVDLWDTASEKIEHAQRIGFSFGITGTAYNILVDKVIILDGNGACAFYIVD